MPILKFAWEICRTAEGTQQEGTETVLTCGGLEDKVNDEEQERLVHTPGH